MIKSPINRPILVNLPHLGKTDVGKGSLAVFPYIVDHRRGDAASGPRSGFYSGAGCICISGCPVGQLLLSEEGYRFRYLIVHAEGRPGREIGVVVLAEKGLVMVDTQGKFL